MIEVVDVNAARRSGDKRLVVYIGRGTIFGNPFVLRDERDREEVCDQHLDYFIERIENDPLFVQELEKLAAQYLRDGYLRLGCHCAPRLCHGNVLASHIAYLAKRQQES